ncbi:hypothetical protein MNBD_GAMMA22-1195 [hydrothermal vent metagenome]|uniref:Uncharacterized protein n=1 Tax=hydrothermal vent metagenome TaxID=652676 RepID=A0A3B1AIK0_9ZZZZ
MINLLSRCTSAIALILGLIPIASATDFSEFKIIAKETIKQVKSGNITDIDKLIAMQSTLLKLGTAASKDYGATNPKAAKMMKLIVAQANGMKRLSLKEIKTQWHNKAFFKGKGIPAALLADKSKTGNYMDVVINPATTYLLLSKYKTTNDKKLLTKVIGELEEVLNNVNMSN